MRTVGPDAVGGPDAKARSDWSRAIELRDTVREWMLAHCGEPDLAQPEPPSATSSSAAPAPKPERSSVGGTSCMVHRTIYGPYMVAVTGLG